MLLPGYIEGKKQPKRVVVASGRDMVIDGGWGVPPTDRPKPD